MIVDIHTHYIDYETEMMKMLKDDIKRCGINEEPWINGIRDFKQATAAADKVFLFGVRGSATGWCTDNEKVWAFAKEAPDRYYFTASIDPQDEDFMEQLVYVHERLNAKMIKLGPIYQGLHPHDKRYRRIYAYCERHNLPILTHMATTFTSRVPMEYARPILMDTVACEYPGLKIIMPHMGHPWEGETISVIRRQPNCYADISALYYRPWQFYNNMRLLEEYGAQGKVFFGSDYPATTTENSLAGIRNVNALIRGTALPPVSHDLIEGIIYRNPIEVLEIM